ncbi:integral membrane protein, TerC family [Schaalia georgiae F0490]|uniref:Integral membrane protein, TerC family n=1 Tax=Schaalia georgiae F0490 TaxID=1125717 RepID=J0P2E4_9ACTO|nr:TerC/Alx family metal homeostasis membrane protein [Schaalia georgiae]EJF51562.1 integral membrane protein, TerC family [Schaalia georgiae F0490]
MEVHAIGWAALAAIIITMITIDIVGHVRTPHEPTIREAAWWSLGYIGFALVFGGLVWAFWGADFGQQYFAGYVTEKALSVDNLFVFVLIITAFRVPRKNQQEVLLAGIVIALVLRLAFILVGKAMIESWSWVFYPFGLWLLWTAFSQIREGAEDPDAHQDEEYRPPSIVRWVSRVVPVTDGFIGGRMLYRHGGRTYVTPLLLCVIAIGTADVMFAVDSIPAIYSLTVEPYLVFAANAFSLLGLRQLYFLIDGLLDRVVYLHYGLAAILGFIGFKLVNHALHTNELPFINGGEHWSAVPEPSIPFSLGFIVVVIVITFAASLAASARRRARARQAETQRAREEHRGGDAVR